MTPRGRKYLFRTLAVAVTAMALGGCISPIPTASGRYTSPIGGSPVISNETPYSGALR
jgi:curli production assembly/transport component CsgG/holdfast attachment protein HfaB